MTNMTVIAFTDMSKMLGISEIDWIMVCHDQFSNQTKNKKINVHQKMFLVCKQILGYAPWNNPTCPKTTKWPRLQRSDSQGCVAAHMAMRTIQSAKSMTETVLHCHLCRSNTSVAPPKEKNMYKRQATFRNHKIYTLQLLGLLQSEANLTIQKVQQKLNKATKGVLVMFHYILFIV